MGLLLVVTAFALLARQLRYSDDALLFTVFFVLGDIGFALIGHSALAYPSGRVTDRAERAFVVVGYATVLIFPALVALFHAANRPLLEFGPLSPKSDLLVSTNDHVVDGASALEVVFPDGRQLTANVIGADRDTDLALLKAHGAGLAHASRRAVPHRAHGRRDRRAVRRRAGGCLGAPRARRF